MAEVAAAPAPPVDRQVLLVSHKQKGNALLGLLRHCFWEYADLPAGDYCMGAGVIAFYLSLRFHALKPLYLSRRLAELGRHQGSVAQASHRLRILLVHIDVEEPARALQAVTLVALDAGCTVVCASSLGEAARYIETFRAYERKGSAAIQERVAGAFLPQATDALTAVRGVNRTDVLTLLSRLGGTLADVFGAPEADLALCPGVGEKKVRRLHDAFTRPFLPPPKPSAADAAAAALAAEVHDPRGAAEVEECAEGSEPEEGGAEGEAEEWARSVVGGAQPLGTRSDLERLADGGRPESVTGGVEPQTSAQPTTTT